MGFSALNALEIIIARAIQHFSKETLLYFFKKKTNVAPYRLRLHTNSVNIPQGETGDMTRVSFCPSEISVCHISGTRCVHRSQEKN